MIVITVTVVFLSRTKSTLLDNLWQVIAQMVSKDTMPILEQAHSMKDTEIEKYWKANQSPEATQVCILEKRDGKNVLRLKEKAY